MFIKILRIFSLGFLFQACDEGDPSSRYLKTVDHLVLEQYLGKWYVIASRPTMFETDAYNATETYALNKKTGKIDIDFKYKKGGFDGPEKSVPQTAWIHNEKSNAHWKISLWWLPFNPDYLIIALDKDYQWTVVGVPNQKHLWIMSRKPEMDDTLLSEILLNIKNSGYDVSNVNRVPQKW